MRHYHGGKPLTAFDEALQRLLDATQPIARTETVGLVDAAYRVLAVDVSAPFDVPPFDRATMDGYAARSADIAAATPEHPVPLRVIGAVYAGDPPPTWVVAEGTCAQIATGAPMPLGADCVVPFEDTQREGATVLVLKAVPPRDNITRRGWDVRQGDRVLAAGAWLTPAKVGVLAALGIDRVPVYAKPKVAIVPTGNEIAQPGRPLRIGQVYDINTYTVAALAAQHGCEPLPMDIVPDEPEALQRTLNAALASAECVIFSAGSAVGERDLLPRLLSERGTVLFHGLAVRPGRPTLAAVVDGKLLVNLPGFPASCLMVAVVMLVPVWRKMARLPAWHPPTVQATLAHEVISPEGLRQFLTVRLAERDGQLIAASAYKESGTITSLSDADGFIVIPETVTHIPAGTTVAVTLL